MKKLPMLEPNRHIAGAERMRIGNELVQRYVEGASIRSLAAATGRSYGFVHRMLRESGVEFRGRGGPRPRHW